MKETAEVPEVVIVDVAVLDDVALTLSVVLIVSVGCDELVGDTDVERQELTVDESDVLPDARGLVVGVAELTGVAVAQKETKLDEESDAVLLTLPLAGPVGDTSDVIVNTTVFDGVEEAVIVKVAEE